MMIRGCRTFKQFQNAGEGIATNILANRLRKLAAAGIITARRETTDRRRVRYRLTEKGIDLAPVLFELLVWGARHQETGAPWGMIEQMAKNREAVLAEARKRWQADDTNPILPPFAGPGRRPEAERIARTNRCSEESGPEGNCGMRREG